MEYSGEAVGEGITQKEEIEQPVYYWDPAVSPSGFTFYSGKEIKEWKNNLFLGCLSGQHMIRLVIDGEKVIAEERLLEDRVNAFAIYSKVRTAHSTQLLIVGKCIGLGFNTVELFGRATHLCHNPTDDLIIDFRSE